MTPEAARAAIAAEPKRYRAAVLRGTKFPLRDHEATEVELAETVADANTHFKLRRKEIEEAGFVKTFGTNALGCIRFAKEGEDDIVLALDKRRR